MKKSDSRFRRDLRRRAAFRRLVLMSWEDDPSLAADVGRTFNVPRHWLGRSNGSYIREWQEAFIAELVKVRGMLTERLQ